MTRFAVISHKPKATAIGKKFLEGARRAGVEARLTSDPVVAPNEIGVFYGVAPATSGLFWKLSGEHRAVYLDNGWLSHPVKPTLRWCWNGVQAIPHLLTPKPKRLHEIGTFTRVKPIYQRATTNNILVVLQSKMYFDYLGIGITRDEWLEETLHTVRAAGFNPVIREKPTKDLPQQFKLAFQIGMARAMISYNSAASIQALCDGLPVYCTGPTALNMVCPSEVPDVTKAKAPAQTAVRDTLERLAGNEFTMEELASGDTIKEIMNVPDYHRYGYACRAEKHRRAG